MYTLQVTNCLATGKAAFKPAVNTKKCDYVAFLSIFRSESLPSATIWLMSEVMVKKCLDRPAAYLDSVCDRTGLCEGWRYIRSTQVKWRTHCLSLGPPLRT